MRDHPGKWAFLLTFSVLFIICSKHVIAAESISILSPQEKHFAGVPILFHIKTNEFFSPKNVTVYYRSIGITVYRKLILRKETPVDFRALLKARKVIPPGIQFYFVVKDGKGRIFTFPKPDPKKNPHVLKIDLDKRPPIIQETVPAEGESLKDRRPVIKIKFTDLETKIDKSSVRLLVDDTDVTQLSKISENYITYQPAENLSFGNHTVILELIDICGNRMPPKRLTFTIPKTARIDNAGAEIQWDAEGRHLIVGKTDTESLDWAIQSSVTLSSFVEHGKNKTSLDANVWYNEEDGPGPEGDNLNLNNFLLKLQHDKHQLSAGDVIVDGTELISQSISRRGGLLELDVADIQADFFALRSNYVTGFKHVLGLDDSEQMLLGGSLEKEILKDRKLTLKTTYIKGENRNPDDYNAGILGGAAEGGVYSISVASRMMDERLNLKGEYSGSRFDDDTSVDEDPKSDNAWLVKVSGWYDKYELAAGYKYLGPDFKSIADPTGAYNQQEYNLDGGVRFGSSDVRLTLLHNRDNVDNDPLLPVIKNSTGTINYNISKFDWLSVFMNYTQSWQNSEKEPQDFDPIENSTQTIGCGLSANRARWDLFPNYNYTYFDDKVSATDNDSVTHVVGLSSGLRPGENISINQLISYTNMHSKFDDVTTETWQGALGGSITPLFSEDLDFNTTLSILDNRTDDGLVHTTTYDCIGQLNWHIEKYLLKKGKQTIAIRGQYNKTKDHETNETQEDYAIYVVISFGVPKKFFNKDDFSPE